MIWWVALEFHSILESFERNVSDSVLLNNSLRIMNPKQCWRDNKYFWKDNKEMTGMQHNPKSWLECCIAGEEVTLVKGFSENRSTPP